MTFSAVRKSQAGQQGQKDHLQTFEPYFRKVIYLICATPETRCLGEAKGENILFDVDWIEQWLIATGLKLSDGSESIPRV